MEIRVSKRTVLALALIVIGILLRVMPHTANFAPVGAIALFAGSILSLRVALWLPLAVMVLSDLIIGLHPLVGFTWGAFALITLVGVGLKKSSNWLRVPLGALASSLIFFVISNFGVWIEGKLYAHTWQGLTDCFVMALPFFRATLTSDLLFSALFFGLYAAFSPAITGTFRITVALGSKNSSTGAETGNLNEHVV
jgi:hypothetical protein